MTSAAAPGWSSSQPCSVSSPKAVQPLTCRVPAARAAATMAGWRVTHVIAGQKEQDAVGALQAGALQRVAYRFGGQFRRRVEAADQAAGDFHAVLPLNPHRSATTQRAHSGLRALHT